MNLFKLLGGTAVTALLLGSFVPDAYAATSGSIAYQYDSLGRVILAQYKVGTTVTATVNYAYDVAGNRITVSVQ
jgi:hypothetical protein